MFTVRFQPAYLFSVHLPPLTVVAIHEKVPPKKPVSVYQPVVYMQIIAKKCGFDKVNCHRW